MHVACNVAGHRSAAHGQLADRTGTSVPRSIVSRRDLGRAGIPARKPQRAGQPHHSLTIDARGTCPRASIVLSLWSLPHRQPQTVRWCASYGMVRRRRASTSAPAPTSATPLTTIIHRPAFGSASPVRGRAAGEGEAAGRGACAGAAAGLAAGDAAAAGLAAGAGEAAAAAGLAAGDACAAGAAAADEVMLPHDT